MNNMSMYDELSPDEAARRAWIVQGPSPRIHEDARRTVREVMPLLARALDRMPVRHYISVESATITERIRQIVDRCPIESVVLVTTSDIEELTEYLERELNAAGLLKKVPWWAPVARSAKSRRS